MAAAATKPAMTTTTTSVTSSSQSTGDTSNEATAKATNAVAAEAIDKAAKPKSAKALRKKQKRAEANGNLTKLAEVAAARAVLHKNHKESTGQDVSAKAKHEDKNKDVQVLVAYVKPTSETLERYYNDVAFAKEVLVLAMDEDKEGLEEVAAKDPTKCELYRTANSLRQPFLKHELPIMKFMQASQKEYRGATCNRDVFKNRLTILTEESLQELNARRYYEMHQQNTVASGIALIDLAIESKSK